MKITKERFFQKTWVIWLCAIICCTLWGSAFPCIKTGYRLFSIASDDSSSQILFAGIRFFLAGILTVLFGSIQSRKPLVPKLQTIPKIAVLSLFQTILQYVLFYIGLAHTTAIKGSIITGSSAFFAILIACIFFRNEQISAKKLLGCVLGFAGLIIVNISGASFHLSMNLLGDTLMLISALSSALSSLLIKVFTKHENTVLLSGYQFFLGGFVMIIIGCALGGTLADVSLRGILLLIYMALISSVAYTLWGILIKYNSVSRIAVFGFLTPVMGVLLSAVILQEFDSIQFSCILALCLVCIGIYLVNHTSHKKICT
jgi:drug/metabolite transporter (DMT)-like permease